jgi:hypothetical protein
MRLHDPKDPQEGQHVTSARKRESNRRNGRKGRGPSTVAGKLRSSRNALRHGFAATIHRQILHSQIELFARMLCGNDHNPLLFEQALTVAENHMMLRLVEAQQLAVVERLWDRTETALARGDNRLRLLKARVRERQLAENLIVPLRDGLLQEYKDDLAEDTLSSDCWLPCNLEDFLENRARELESEALKKPGVRFHSDFCMKPRDELAAMQEGARDLLRLERYERQAWSRLKKAICRFIDLKVKALATRVPANPSNQLPSFASNSDCQK